MHVLGAGVVAAFEQFQQHGAHAVIGILQRPFIGHQQRGHGLRPRDLRDIEVLATLKDGEAMHRA